VKRALVTGSAGFVGRHMTQALDDAGWELDTVDIVDGVDARDFFRQDRGRYDLVVHLAAVVGGRMKIEGAPLELAVDLSIDAELFSWALRTRPGRVVYFSSSAAYPVRHQTAAVLEPLHEIDLCLDEVDDPDLLYGWAKLTGEILARHARDAGVPVSVLRPFSGYGEDQPLDYPFPSFIDRARRRADPFVIWGSGEQVRDFVHIDDVVDATLAAVGAEVDGPLNIGTGRATSFNQLADMVCAEAGYTPTFVNDLSKPTGVSWRVASTLRLSDIYTPKVTLEEGIHRALADSR
jgi:nucleoside-diphosphate-sugar epimerase